MGSAKALLPLGPETFLTRIVATLREADIDDVVIVLGHDAEAIRAALEVRGVDARLVVNAGYDAGQLSSLVAGIGVVDRPGVEAALVTLVDVPLVSPATVRAVVDRYRATHAAIVRPARDGRFGHPMIVDRSLFAAFRTADPTQGAKPIVRAHATPEGAVEVDDEGAFVDVDTPGEYQSIAAHVRADP
jgi:molybdenum cofactor cytidylyltransferase